MQGSNPDLLHCRWILYCLRHQGSPRILKWVAYPSSGDLPHTEIDPESPYNHSIFFIELSRELTFIKYLQHYLVYSKYYISIINLSFISKIIIIYKYVNITKMNRVVFCAKSLSHVQFFLTLWTVAHQAPGHNLWDLLESTRGLLDIW